MCLSENVATRLQDGTRIIRLRDEGALSNIDTAPKIGLVSLKQGTTPPQGVEVVQPGQKGIQQQVLTPGTYKINPFLYEVKLEPAIVVPPGSVGVVTRLSGDIGQVSSATLTEIRASTSGPATQPLQGAPRVPIVDESPSRRRYRELTAVTLGQQRARGGIIALTIVMRFPFEPSAPRS